MHFHILHFNSRLRKETNDKLMNFFYVVAISIHVSARRRTPKNNIFFNWIWDFNSRLRKETNLYGDVSNAIMKIFQLTSPQGDELCLISTIGLFYIFQFASPQGDEPNYHDLMIIQDHFNSRLRKETNLNHILRSISVFQISIHVFVVRRTQQSYHFPAYAKISIHVSARERTPSFKCSLNALSVLQLTSPQGDENGTRWKVYIGMEISTHVSARRRTKAGADLVLSRAISTHVSVRRRTFLKYASTSLGSLFQLTSP